MADKMISYFKRIGDSLTPMTIRLEWLLDGTIKPLMYWTPDGTCYNVISLLESVKLAYLKERGEGLRFKVRSEVIETPDEESALLHTRSESYLYLDDKRFSAKNIIDSRYGHANKEYITVTLDIFPDGDYELLYFQVHSERYMIETTLDVEPRGSFHAGGIGIWHKVEARLVNAGDDEYPSLQKSVRRVVALYWELDKWFISIAKTA